MIPNTDGMPDVRESGMTQSDLVQRMEDQRMSESDRRLAAESLRDGESLADIIVRAKGALQSTAALLENYFAQRSK